MSGKTAVDLHLHSNYSDGEYSVRELILLVKEIAAHKFGDRLERIVISAIDHDTLAGQREALELGKTFGVGVIAGSEITTLRDGQILHEPFYFNTSRLEEIEENKEINMILRNNTVVRREKDKRIIRGLRSKGYSVTYNEVELVKPKSSSGGTPYVVKVLLRKYPDLEKENIDDVFALVNSIERLSRHDSSLSYPDLIAVTKILGRARVVPVLAHPLRSNLRRVKGVYHDFTILGGGLGIECYYPYHRFKKSHEIDLTPYQKEIDRFCEDNNLVRTGGSDCHGNHFGDKRNLFDVDVPDWVADKLLEKIEDVEKIRSE